MTCEDPDPIPGAECAVGLGSTHYNTTVGGITLPTTINPFVDPRSFGWRAYAFGEDHAVPIDQPFYRGNGKFFANPVPGEEPERIIVTVRSPAENGLAFMPIIVSPVEMRDAHTGLPPELYYSWCDEWREVTAIETNGTVLNRESIWRDTLFADGSVWISDPQTGFVFRLDPSTGELIARISVSGGPFRMVYAYGDIWVTQLWLGAAVRISTSTNTVVAWLPDISKNAFDIADAGGFIWVSDPERSKVYKIDPATNQAVSNVAVPTAGFLAFDGSLLWSTIDFPFFDSPTGGYNSELNVIRQLALRSIDIVTENVHQVVVDEVPDYRSPKNLSFDGFHLWYTDATRLYRIDPDTGEALSRHLVSDLAIGATASPNGKLWADQSGYDLTGELVEGSVNLGGTTLTTVTYAFDDWWVGNIDGTLFRVDGETSVISDIIPIGSIPPYIGSAGYITSICADSTVIYVTAEVVTPSGPPHYHYLFKINRTTGIIIDQTPLMMYDSRAVFYDGDIWAVGSAVTSPADHMVKRINAFTMTVVDDFYIETGAATCLIAAGDSQIVISNGSTKMWYFDTTESNLPDYPDYESIAINPFLSISISSLIYDGQNFCVALEGIIQYEENEYGVALARKVGATWESFDLSVKPNYQGFTQGLSSDGQDYWYSTSRGSSVFIRRTGQFTADIFVPGFGAVAVSDTRVATTVGTYLYILSRGDVPVSPDTGGPLCRGVMNGDTLWASAQDGRLVSVDTLTATTSYSGTIPLSDFDQWFTSEVLTQIGRESYWVSPQLGRILDVDTHNGINVYVLYEPSDQHGSVNLAKLGSDGRVIDQVTNIGGSPYPDQSSGQIVFRDNGELCYAANRRFGVLNGDSDGNPSLSFLWTKEIPAAQLFGNTSIGLAYGTGLDPNGNDSLTDWLYVLSDNNNISAHQLSLGNSAPGFVIDLNIPTLDWSVSYKAQGVVANDALWVNGGTKLFQISGSGLIDEYGDVSTYLVDKQAHGNDIVDVAVGGVFQSPVIWIAYGGSVDDESPTEIDTRGSLYLVDANTTECRQVGGAAATGKGMTIFGLTAHGSTAHAAVQSDSSYIEHVRLMSATINDFDNIWDVEYISEYVDTRSLLTNTYIPLAVYPQGTSPQGFPSIYGSWSSGGFRNQVRRFAFTKWAMLSQSSSLSLDDASNSNSHIAGPHYLSWTGQFNTPTWLNLAQGETASVLIDGAPSYAGILIAGDAELDASQQGVYEPYLGYGSWTPSVNEQLEIVCVEWIYDGGRSSVGIIIV